MVVEGAADNNHVARHISEVVAAEEESNLDARHISTAEEEAAAGANNDAFAPIHALLDDLYRIRALICRL